MPEPPKSPTKFKNGLRPRKLRKPLSGFLPTLAARDEHGVLPIAAVPSLFVHQASAPDPLFADIGDLTFLDPFPLFCAFICIHAGRLRTTLHREHPAVILAETEHLCCVHTIESVENRGAPFWILRERIDRKRNNIERRERSRRHRTLRAPCWTGEERPRAKTVPIESHFPESKYLERLAELGFPKAAVLACLIQAHKPWMRPPADRRSAKPVKYEKDRDDHETLGGKDYQEFGDPDHAYVPGAPSRRTFFGGGFTKEQVVRAIERRRWDDATSQAVFEIVYTRRFSKEVAEERKLPLKRLHEYAWRVRKDTLISSGNPSPCGKTVPKC